jgi:hypothetical protein
VSNRRAQDERIEGTPDGVNAITEIVDVPDAPTIGTANAGLGNASVAFTPSTTGGTVSTFTATSNPGNVTGTSATSPITVSGLTGGTAYTFTVSGQNSTGTSPLSSASNLVTPTELDGAYYALATVTLDSAASSIVFTGIPTNYTHLHLRASLTSATDNPNNAIVCRFNGDVATTYSRHVMYGGRSTSGGTDSAAAEGAANTTSVELGFTTGTTEPSVFIADILDYASTFKFKTTRALGGADRNGSGYLGFNSGNWRSTSIISTITITHGASANWGTNSTFALYGVK